MFTLPKNTKFTILEEDYSRCWHCIKNREERDSQDQGYASFKRTPDSYFQMNLPALLAEVGLARFIGVDFEYSLIDFNSPTEERGYDIVLDNGAKVDVKWTKYDHGKLLVPVWMEKKKGEVDYFALVTGINNDFTFRGMMKSEDLIVPQRKGSVGYGDNFIAQQFELYDLPY